MEDHQLDPLLWYGQRKLDFEPAHFVRARTAITKKSSLWITDSLRGRYTLLPKNSEDDMMIDPLNYIPSFEDPSEAVFYELTWS